MGYFGHIYSVAYPELVSRGVSERRKCKWLVMVGASNGVTPLIKKNHGRGGGGSGQPENPPGYATDIISHTHSDMLITRENRRQLGQTKNYVDGEHNIVVYDSMCWQQGRHKTGTTSGNLLHPTQQWMEPNDKYPS